MSPAGTTGTGSTLGGGGGTAQKVDYGAITNQIVQIFQRLDAPQAFCDDLVQHLPALVQTYKRDPAQVENMWNGIGARSGPSS